MRKSPEVIGLLGICCVVAAVFLLRPAWFVAMNYKSPMTVMKTAPDLALWIMQSAAGGILLGLGVGALFFFGCQLWSRRAKKGA